MARIGEEEETWEVVPTPRPEEAPVKEPRQDPVKQPEKVPA